jgi:hypothetical protein
MPTAKEEAQAQRLAQNEENQRRQDEFGYAIAKLEADRESGDDLAAETRRLHAEDIKRDQESQTDNDTSTPDDSLVSSAVDEELDAYVERNVVVGDVDEVGEAPEAAAYADDPTGDGAPEEGEEEE